MADAKAGRRSGLRAEAFLRLDFFSCPPWRSPFSSRKKNIEKTAIDGEMYLSHWFFLHTFNTSSASTSFSPQYLCAEVNGLIIFIYPGTATL